jgi:hypothetical protein
MRHPDEKQRDRRSPNRAARTERRAAARLGIFKGARIQVSGGVPIKCVVRDISPNGARIERRGPIMSDAFNLSFDDLVWPQEIACRVVWRADGIMGVEFEAAVAIPEAPSVPSAD